MRGVGTGGGASPSAGEEGSRARGCAAEVRERGSSPSGAHSPPASNRGCRSLTAGLRAPLPGCAGREPRPRLATQAAPSSEARGGRGGGEWARPARESGGVRDLWWPKKWIGMEDSVIAGDGAEGGEGNPSEAGAEGGDSISVKIRRTTNGRADTQRWVENPMVRKKDGGGAAIRLNGRERCFRLPRLPCQTYGLTRGPDRDGL